jgi:hypothetical protein
LSLPLSAPLDVDGIGIGASIARDLSQSGGKETMIDGESWFGSLVMTRV